MKTPCSQPIRTLGIAPSSRGFGFAVLDGFATLVDWGVKSVQGDKNLGSVAKISKLIDQYKPDRLVMEDFWYEDSRRAERIRILGESIRTLAGEKRIKLRVIPLRKAKRLLANNEEATKHEVATALAKRFPDQLAKSLPAKRKLWMSEDHRMDFFRAVALAVTSIS